MGKGKYFEIQSTTQFRATRKQIFNKLKCANLWEDNCQNLFFQSENWARAVVLSEFILSRYCPIEWKIFWILEFSSNLRPQSCTVSSLDDVIINSSLLSAHLFYIKLFDDATPAGANSINNSTSIASDFVPFFWAHPWQVKKLIYFPEILKANAHKVLAVLTCSDIIISFERSCATERPSEEKIKQIKQFIQEE